jgi:hypothetical protein
VRFSRVARYPTNTGNGQVGFIPPSAPFTLD